MKLSIVIVNYNVKHFLEQCLHSVMAAIQGIESEVFVVDNDSVDGSCDMVRNKFPQVIIIENKENLGFSKANNQAIRVSKGEYVLLLNPDTVVEEDTFRKVIEFMDSTPDAGGLGVKMIDGKGNFLPESKRALPTPSVAFYKIFGLSKIFPKSKKFGRYHLGHLDPSETHSVEVLAGAFMLLRKTVLDEIGLLDETFFMYGEDIDLSHRINLGGYKNYYFPKTTIIHYKGESTKKGSINYVMVFYNAMIIFAKKHFSGKNARLFTLLINTAIYIRAFAAVLNRFIKNLVSPLLDAGIIFFGYYLIKPYWESYKFPEGGSYPKEFLMYVVPGYIIIWLISVYFSGGYERPVRILRLLRGILAGTAVILLIYSLLSEELRFSRALILIGAGYSLIALSALRLALHATGVSFFRFYRQVKKKIVIVGAEEEAHRIRSILSRSNVKFELVGNVACDSSAGKKGYIGDLNQLREIVLINKINEIIFCARDIASQKIIRNMLNLSDIAVDFKIASPDGESIIGSNSIDTAGDLYVIHLNSIAKENNRRKKRTFDVVTSITFLITIPFIIFFIKNRAGFVQNIFSVLLGTKTWVGYCPDNKDNKGLPPIPASILTPLDRKKSSYESMEFNERINLLYAKDYKISNDFGILFQGFRQLGRKTQI